MTIHTQPSNNMTENPKKGFNNSIMEDCNNIIDQNQSMFSRQDVNILLERYEDALNNPHEVIAVQFVNGRIVKTDVSS